MKKRRRSNAQISRSYHSRMRNLLKGHTEKEIFESLSGGKNNYLRLDRLLSSSFDKSWIEMIEGCIFDLGDIISNPRLSTKEVEYIVPIELARKITAKSVQHLAANTQYIREIDEYGNVIPRKILTVAHEDDILTYENRFIATLIRRLVLFIEKRYEIVSEFAELRNEEILMFKNESLVNDALVEIETKVKVSYKSDDELSLKSNAYIARIVKIREHIQYFYNSDFMRHFKTERDVRNPIIRTNIIRKDPKYSHCYRLYRFIEKYDRLGVNYKVSDKYSLFNKKEIEELNNTIFANYVTLKGKDLKNNSQTKSRVYKPKILKSLDDEIFIYGPLVRTPISFVRVDSHYQKYLDNKIKKDLPRYPTKKEREYYATEYKEKKENAEDKKQLDSLLRRKERENRTFEKNVKNILKQREKARQTLEEQEQTIIKKEEEGRLSVAREAIVTASLEHKEVEKKELEKKELEKKKVKSSASKTTKKEKKAPLKSIEDKQPEEVQRLPKKTIKKPIPIEKKPIVSTPKVKSASEETTLIEPKTETENVPIEAQTPLEEAKIVVEEVKKPRAKRSTNKKENIEQPLAVELKFLPVEKPEEAVEPVGKEVVTEKKTTKRVKKATKAPREEKEAIEEKPTAEQTQAVGEISEPVKKARKPRAKRVLEKVEPVSEIIPEDKQSFEPESNDQSSLENQQTEIVEAALVVEQVSEKTTEPVEQKSDDVASLENQQTETAEAAPIVEQVPETIVSTEQEPDTKVSVEDKKPEIVEEPSAPKKVRKPRTKKAQLVEQDKTPAVEEKPKEEMEQVKENKTENSPKKKAPAKKKAETKKTASQKVKHEKILGKFIVKTNKGYYVNENSYSVYKDDAKVFDDFNAAQDVKNQHGGKVVKV